MPEWEEEVELQPKKPNKLLSAIFTVVLVVLVAFLGVRIFVSSTCGAVLVKGTSMQNTLQGGEWLLMHLTKKGAKAQRGDIVVLNVQGKEGATAEEGFLIKRLIATEGDKFYCKGGRIFIWYNGTDGFVELEEPYAYYSANKSMYSFASYETPYELGEGEIFYLGDNRIVSKDSQEEFEAENGLILKETDIHGVVYDWAVTYQTPIRLLLLTETFFK